MEDLVPLRVLDLAGHLAVQQGEAVRDQIGLVEHEAPVRVFACPVIVPDRVRVGIHLVEAVHHRVRWSVLQVHAAAIRLISLVHPATEQLVHLDHGGSRIRPMPARAPRSGWPRSCRRNASSYPGPGPCTDR